ncbi:UNVERIFIED_CONTAM: hypothetical protein RMT77_000525 [Armadillidium vulgare]
MGKSSVIFNDAPALAASLNVGEALIRMRFIETMLERVCAVLAARTDVSLDVLGYLANDAISQPFRGHSVMSPSRIIHGPPTTNSSTSQIPLGIRPFSESERPQVCRYHLY